MRTLVNILGVLLVGAMLGIGIETGDVIVLHAAGVSVDRTNLHAVEALDGILLFAISSICWKRRKA